MQLFQYGETGPASRLYGLSVKGPGEGHLTLARLNQVCAEASLRVAGLQLVTPVLHRSGLIGFTVNPPSAQHLLPRLIAEVNHILSGEVEQVALAA
jgi:hypothetical protein